MTVSPLTPLNFREHRTDGLQSDFMQTFATTDRILLQLLGPTNFSVTAYIIDELTDVIVWPIKFGKWDVNDTTTLKFAELSLSPGYYSVEIHGLGNSDVFRVTDDPVLLADTTLIQYSNRDNRQRDDTLFFIDSMQYFFDFRVPGGFKDSSWTFGVESEQFVTPAGDLSQLYGLATTQKKFTLGSSIGVPVWMGERLNRILTCSHVYFDGVKYCRKDTSTPEMTVQLEGTNSFVFTQSLQQSVRLDPVIEQKNHAIMRRVSTDEYRTTTNTQPIFNRQI